MEKKNLIYHIVTLDDLKAQTKNNYFKPNNLGKDGFIHCAADKSTSLFVLEDYFAEASKSTLILILEIDTAKVKSKVKYEFPAPIQGGGRSHIREGILFPHIYGKLNIDAVVGAGIVERVENKFKWPSAFDCIEKYYEKNKQE